jgi:uncharacterized protein with FMN-binding domain
LRRITFTIVTTLAVLVLLFSYRTSRNETISATTVAVGHAHIVPGTSAGSVAASGGPDPTRTPVATAKSPAQPTSTAPSTPGVTTSAATKTKKSTATATSSSALSATVDGAAVGTPYGDVQVEVVIAAGKITDVNAIQYPNGQPRDQEINQFALPQLRSQVLDAQSANIAGVGGATYTTQGYVGSLQSALDQVHFP